jgi:hypothetical protein
LDANISGELIPKASNATKDFRSRNNILKPSRANDRFAKRSLPVIREERPKAVAFAGPTGCSCGMNFAVSETHCSWVPERPLATFRRLAVNDPVPALRISAITCTYDRAVSTIAPVRADFCAGSSPEFALLFADGCCRSHFSRLIEKRFPKLFYFASLIPLFFHQRRSPHASGNDAH